jgi:hypothetical protein
VRYHVGRAVCSLGATPGSVISFEEPFDTWRRLFERQIKYWTMQLINAVGWLAIVLLIDLTARLLKIEYIFRVPLKKIATALGSFGHWLKAVLSFLFGH